MIELENDRRYLNQWELDQRVQIDNFLPGTWVEFSVVNDVRDSTLITEAYAECGHVYANIPNVLFQNYGYLHIYVNPSPSEMAQTPEEKYIKIVRRKKPGNYIYTETPTVSYKAIEDRVEELEKNGVSQEAIEAAVTKYLQANPIETGSKLTIGVVELLADKWVGDASPYSQVVAVKASDGTDPVTECSQVDLTPSVEQLAIFHDKDLAFVTENEDGVVTVYAIGDKPLNDYTMQVTIKEVSV